MLIEHDSPRAHLIVDDFFAPPALRTIFGELPSLERRMKPGLVREIGRDGQSIFFDSPRRKNAAVWIREPAKTLRLFRDRLWSPEMLAAFDDAREPLFQVIRNCSAPILQVSRYTTGDHYDFHEDEGAGVNLTAIVFLAARPEKVRGGDLVLAYRGAETKIRFRHNRLVIFPSKTPHRVTRVRIASTDPRDARISLQSWLAYGSSEGHKAKPGAAEVDRPTFLLGDESITEAAQQLLGVAGGDASSSAQSPDVVYWGTFYLSRILTQNLRALVATIDGAKIGPLAIRRGESIEVFASARVAGMQMRIGFELRGPEVPPYEALSLFAEAGRRRERLDLPPNVEQSDAVALLRKLVAKLGSRRNSRT